MSARTLQDRLDALVGSLPGGPTGPRGAALRVEVPEAGFAHAAAAGIARADTGEAMTVGHRWHAASVGKMFTATLVLRAAEEGRFGPGGIDTPLGAIAAAPADLVRGIHPVGPAITLRQLLTHTSGLKDMQGDDASGTAADHRGAAPDSVQASYVRSLEHLAAGDPGGGDGACFHRWVPWDGTRPGDPEAGMLDRFLATGTASVPVGAPGERFHYSDTAYVLLGVLTEAVTGRRYHDLQRDAIVGPLGLADTYLAYADDPTPDARRHEADIWHEGLPLLSLGADVSFDWGGGGQVSTIADLCRFLRALLAGDLHHERATTASMAHFVTPAGLTEPFDGVGLGLLRWRAGRRTVVGHAGAWGVRCFHDPSSGAYVTGTVLQRDPCDWLSDAFDAVDDELG